MTLRSTFAPFIGGIDQASQPLAVQPGRCIAARNFESVLEGYHRIDGYERFDGRTSPTATFAAADPGEEAADREAARAAIQKPAGSGPIRGLWSYNGDRYCWRDSADATACICWKATAGGWVAVPMGFEVAFTSGGTAEIAEGDTVTGATSGATAIVRRVAVTDGAWPGGDAAGYLTLASVTGTFVAETLNVGTSTDVATIGGAPAAQAFAPGGRYAFKTHNFYGAADRRRVYGVNGVGPAFEFDGTTFAFVRTGMIDDTPSRVAVFKQQLFLAFPGGSVQHSAPGEPLVFAPIIGAGEIGMGDEVVDFISNTLDTLLILSATSVAALTGTGADDWLLSPLTDEAGAIAHTAQRLGTALYLDNRGLRTIGATQAYGNFRLGTLTSQIQVTLDSLRRAGIVPVASCVVRAKDQYRLFYTSGLGVSVYLGRKYPEPMLFEYGFAASCICIEEDATGAERIFAGADDGWVYELDVGTSFDGTAIEAFVMTGFGHEGAPGLLKRWQKARLELIARIGTAIGVAGEFDYAGGEQPSLPQRMFQISAGGGGLWNVHNWDEFYWSTPVAGTAEVYLDGQGRNMALVIASNDAETWGYTLQGLTRTFAVRGQLR